MKMSYAEMQFENEFSPSSLRFRPKKSISGGNNNNNEDSAYGSPGLKTFNG